MSDSGSPRPRCWVTIAESASQEARDALLAVRAAAGATGWPIHHRVTDSDEHDRMHGRLPLSASGWQDRLTQEPTNEEVLVRITHLDRRPGRTIDFSDFARSSGMSQMNIAVGEVDIAVSISHPKISTEWTTLGELERYVRQWLRPPGEDTLDESDHHLAASIERLVNMIDGLRDDNERLTELLAKAYAENEQLRHRNADLARHVLELQDKLDSMVKLGIAVRRGTPIDEREATWFANHVGKILSHAGIGILGNRSDATFTWLAARSWPELQPIAEAIQRVVDAAGGTPL